MTNKNRFGDIHISAIALVVLSALFYCYEYLLRISPNVMVPSLMEQFGLTAGGVGWLVFLYYFAYTPLQIVVGVITDRYGAKRILAWAIAACILGSALFPATHSVAIAGLGRVLIGLGSAFAYVGALAIANRTLSKAWFTFFAGTVTSLGMLGAISGNIGMSYLMGHYNWALIMHIGVFAGLGLLAVFLLAAWAHNNTGLSKRKSDKAEKGDIASFKTLGRIISNKHFIVLGCIGALLFLSLDVFAELWGIQFLQVARGISLDQATWINSLIFWGWAIGSLSQVIFFKLLKSVRSCLIIQAFLASIAISLALIFAQSASTIVIESLLFLFGFFCSAEVLCFTQGVLWVRNHAVATAVAVLNFFVMLSGMVFQPVVSKILDLNWSGGITDGHRVYAAGDFLSALVILPIAALVAAGLAFALPKKKMEPIG